MQVTQSDYAKGITGFTVQEIVPAKPLAYEACKSLLLKELNESKYPTIVRAIRECPPTPETANQVDLRELRKRIAACFFSNIDELMRLAEDRPMIRSPFVNLSILQQRDPLNPALAMIQLIVHNEYELAHEMVRKMASFPQVSRDICDRWYFYIAHWYAGRGDYEETRAILQEWICPQIAAISQQALGGRIVSYVLEKRLHEDTKTLDSELVCSLLLNPKIVPELDERVKLAFQMHAQRGPRTCGRMLQMITTRYERSQAVQRLQTLLTQEAYAALQPYISLEIACSPKSEQVWEVSSLPDSRNGTFLVVD